MKRRTWLKSLGILSFASIIPKWVSASWASLSSNQLVSGSNLQDAVDTSVFTLRPSQTITKTTRIVTRQEANDWIDIVSIPYDNRGVKKSELIANVIPSDAVGIIVVDITNTPTLEACGFIDGTGGIPFNSPVYKSGNNFSPASTPAADCWALASDAISNPSLKFRFEFNVKRLILSYPSETEFVFKIRGRGTSSGSVGITYDLKGGDSGNMTMTGSPGSYIPSVDTPSNLGSVATTRAYGDGADGNIGLAYGTDIITLTYNVAAKTVTAS